MNEVNENQTVMRAVFFFLRVEMQAKSHQTRTWYQKRLFLLARTLGETRKLSTVTENDLLRWREENEKKNLSPDTLHGYIRAARRLFSWLHERGILQSNISKYIYLPKLPKRGKQGISEENAQLILKEAQRTNVRDYAMLLFFAATSARRRGVSELRQSDLNLDLPEPICRQVTVFEKGEKERVVLMDEKTVRALRAWMDVRPGSSEFIFVSDKGEKLKADSVSEVIDRYKKRLGINGKCSPHQWRHRWFRRVLSNRMPLTQAAQIGGHENVQLTYQYYGQYAVEELQSAYDKYYLP